MNSFFMEDIDLSFRIRQAGFSNNYLAGTCIVHFKGESTIKGNQYSQQFYEAMRLFVKKHFRSGSSQFFNPVLNISIWSAGKAGRLKKFFNPALQSRPPQSRKTFLDGNCANMEQIMHTLTVTGRSLVGEMGAANEIVFLEGKFLCYVYIISRMRAFANKYSFKIHGQGAKYRGSDSKDEQENHSTVIVWIRQPC
jgi:hypothetical protein